MYVLFSKQIEQSSLVSVGTLYGTRRNKIVLEAFKNLQVAISGLNPDHIETIAQYGRRQLRSAMLNATAVVSSLLGVLVAFFLRCSCVARMARVAALNVSDVRWITPNLISAPT